VEVVTAVAVADITDDQQCRMEARHLLLHRHRRKAIRTTMARTMVALAHHRWRLVECLQQALALKHHRHHMRLPLQYILLFVRRRRARVDRR